MKLDLFRRDGRPSRRRRLAVVVTALAAVAIALTPAGSASPPSSGIKQYTLCLAQSATPPGTCDTSALPGGSMVSLTLTITNANSSTQSLGSANVDGPVGSNGQPVFPINLDPAKGPLPTFVSGTGTFGTNTSGELQLRNLTVAPGSSPLRVSFSVVTSCTGGSGTWKAPAKQSNNFLGNGNDFALIQSAGLTSSVGSGGCKLVWLYPPNHANKNATITNTAYTPTVGGTVHNVAVQAVAADGVTPLDLNSGTATLAKTAGSFDCVSPCDFGGLTSTTFQHGVATFPTLTSANTGTGFTLQASATGLQPTPDSDPPFNISIDGKPCDPGASCSLSNELLGGKADSRLDVSAGSGLTFLAVNPYVYDPNFHPCGTNFVHVQGATGFDEYHGGVPTGMTVTYYVNQKNIDATYGKNVGAQYIPICAGTFKLVDGVITLCDTNATNDTSGWPTAEIDSSGRFTGAIGHAVCRSDGRYWGIVPSFQDKTDPALGPQTASWGSKIIDGVTYRFFTMKLPSDWDYRGGN